MAACAIMSVLLKRVRDTLADGQRIRSETKIEFAASSGHGQASRSKRQLKSSLTRAA